MAYTTIDLPSEYFNTKLTTGTGSSQAVTGLGFQPDWIWGKRRDSTGNNSLFDSVRGITKGLESNSTGAEFTSTDYYSSFDSDGFTIAAGASGAGNGSGQTAVQWCWKAGGTASSNTDGSITSNVSANTTSGFSIVSYTGNSTSGATVGHSLGTTPSTIIVKVLNEGTYNWNVYTKSLGATKTLKLNLTNAEQTSSIRWNDTEPTSSVFSLGNAGEVNETGKNYIAYCFADVKGYSKVGGSYTGNGNANGTFVYTGFRPAFVLIKANSAGQDWHIHDIKRSTFNVSDTVLLPNTIDADITDTTVYGIDILSNGFKCRGTHPRVNGSGTGYIYMAFAENPFVTSTGIPTTAR